MGGEQTDTCTVKAEGGTPGEGWRQQGMGEEKDLHLKKEDVHGWRDGSVV